MFKALIYGLLVVAELCLAARFSAADDILSAHEHELRAALAQDVIDPHQVLQALLGESGRFHSGDHEPDGFSVEILGFDDQGEEVRLIGDFGADGFRSLEFRGQREVSFRHNQDSVQYKSKQWRLSKTENVCINWNSILDCRDEPASIDVSIASMLHRNPVWTHVEFQAGISELRAFESSGRMLVVRLRTPHDAVRFGSTISHASIWRRGNCLRELRRPVRGQSDQRLPRLERKDFEAMKERIDRNPAQTMSLHEWFFRGGANRSTGAFDESMKKLITACCIGESLPIQFDEWHLDHVLPEQVRHPGVVAERIDRRVFRETDFFSMSAQTLLFKLSASKRESSRQEDHATRNWFCERYSALFMLNPFIKKMTPRMLMDSESPPARAVANLVALSEMGRPATLRIQLSQMGGSALFRAVLGVGWDYPFGHDDIQILKDAASGDSSPSNRYLANLCLLRSDRYDLVVQSERSKWWNQTPMEVILNCAKGGAQYTLLGNGDVLTTPEAVSEVDDEAEEFIRRSIRWATIWELSRFPTSRVFLMSRLRSSDPLPIRQSVLSALRLRARESYEQQRFDFMPRAECAEILSIPDFEVSGRDSSSGTARPFPADP